MALVIVIRMFLSAVSDSDLPDLIRMFQEDVVPAFEAEPGCLGIELVRADKAGVGGLIEGGVMTRWVSHEAMEAGLQSPAVVASQTRIREMLTREPLRKVYEVVA